MKKSIILILLFIALTQYSYPEDEIGSEVLAIPSFTNRTGSDEYGWLSEALADMLTTDITSSKKIMVVNRVEMKKILDEQQLALNGLVQNSEIQIGQMVGANLILSGSYTILNSLIRIDVQIINAGEGTAVGATSVMGDIQNYFVLQKKLSIKTFEALNISLSEEEQITLFQVDSKNSKAIENNYKGILALEKKDLKIAEDYFSQAVQIDPYYKGAKDNLNALKVDVKGNYLFSSASAILDKKEKQKQSLEYLTNDFIKSYYLFKLDPKKAPRIETNSNQKEKIKVFIPLQVDIDNNSIKNYIEQLKLISEGELRLIYKASRIYSEPQTVCLFKENSDFYIKKYLQNCLVGLTFCGFKIDKYVQIKSENQILYQHHIIIARESGGDWYNPDLFCGICEHRDDYRGIWIWKEKFWFRKGQEIEIPFSIRLEDLEKITSVEISDTMKY